MLKLCSCMNLAEYRPRNEWLQLLSRLLRPVLQGLADAADAHIRRANTTSAAATSPLQDLQRAGRGGLIQMPEQQSGHKDQRSVAPDEVVTADGRAVTMPLQGPGWEGVPQLSPPEWTVLSQVVMMWELPGANSDEWVQAYVDASYGAMVATGRLVSEHLEATADGFGASSASVMKGVVVGRDGMAQEDEEGEVPLSQRVLDTSVLADVATSVLLLGARPEERWVSALAAASGAVFAQVASEANQQQGGGSGGSGGGVSGLTANPAALANLIMVMRQSGMEPDKEWVETALLAVVAGPGSEDPGSVRGKGDAIAGLVFEVARSGESWSEQVVSAVVALAERLAPLWEAQLRVTSQRRAMQGAGAAQGGGSASGDGQEAADITGLSAQGQQLLLIGLAQLGVLPLMSPKWMQVCVGVGVRDVCEEMCVGMRKARWGGAGRGSMMDAGVRVGGAVTHGAVSRWGHERCTQITCTHTT